MARRLLLVAAPLWFELRQSYSEASALQYLHGYGFTTERLRGSALLDRIHECEMSGDKNYYNALLSTCVRVGLICFAAAGVFVRSSYDTLATKPTSTRIYGLDRCEVIGGQVCLDRTKTKGQRTSIGVTLLVINFFNEKQAHRPQNGLQVHRKQRTKRSPCAADCTNLLLYCNIT